MLGQFLKTFFKIFVEHKMRYFVGLHFLILIRAIEHRENLYYLVFDNTLKSLFTENISTLSTVAIQFELK